MLDWIAKLLNAPTNRDIARTRSELLDALEQHAELVESDADVTTIRTMRKHYAHQSR